MAGLTPNFQLSSLNSGDDFTLDGYKFTDADRVLIDRLLHAALTHDHTGVAAENLSEAVDTAPVLTLDPFAGSLPAGVRFYYKVALVGEDGLPTLASPETTIDSPLPVLAPDAPTASRSATLGTLLPGTYYYRLSAYRGASTLETGAGDPVAVPLPVAAGTTQRVILTLPSVPLGAEGYNIYRRIPGGSAFVHIATVPIADIGDPWIDDGSLAVNCERFSPSLNTTSSSNSVEIAYPGGVIPVGYTWRIYRTDTPGAWAHSWLIDVAEETEEGSGIVTPVFLDLGMGTRAGGPPATTPPSIPTPAQISFEDILDAPTFETAGAVVQVHLGTLDAPDQGLQTRTWACPHRQAMIRAVHANVSLGPSGDVTIEVELYDETAGWRPIQETGSTCTILAGEVVSVIPDVDLDTIRDDHPELHVYDLIAGDQLRFTITTSDNSISDLEVQILLWVRETGPQPTWPDLV